MITRRQFIKLSTSAVALASAGTMLSTTGYGQETMQTAINPFAEAPKEALPDYLASGSKKKGLCLGTWGNPNWSDWVLNLHCKWFYTWEGYVPRGIPPGMEFVPMIRSKHSDPERVADIQKSFEGKNIKELLGLNEPDHKSQDGFSVEEALNLWPRLMDLGLRLGSPACVHPENEWMVKFMEGVEERKLRVDFVCVHHYGGPSPEQLVAKLEGVEKRYKRPIWITEFAVGDWGAKNVKENKNEPRDVRRFMERVLPKLDRLDCLERYAWFSANTDDAALGTSALFTKEGELTKLGECYRDS